MKQSLIVFFALLVLASCRKKEEESAPVPVASIEVDPATLRLRTSDSPKQLIVKVNPADATNGEVKWISSDASKATVNATGLVTPLAKGTTTITATSVADPSKKATCEVTVTSIFISEITITSLSTTVGVGRDLQLTATVKPDNAENKELTWSSDNPSIASVDATGKVKGEAKGSAVITATAKDEGGVTQTITISVKQAVTSITILTENPVVSTGATTTLTATVAPADAAQAVTWSSSDATKATIDAATGIATGVAVGETTITATATDGSGITKTTKLTVKSSDASITTITLGAENFNVNVPAPEVPATLKNAPRTIASNLTAVPTSITLAANATIKMGTAAFTTGDNVNFTSPVDFIVTAQDGVTTKTYKVGITTYNATTNPYGVYTVLHLNDVRNDKRGSYKLMNSITLPNTDAEGVVAATGIDDYATAGWRPIAHDASGGYPGSGGFAGTFDGAGFRIENLYVNRTIEVGGLFGGGNSCTIKNLEVRGTTTKTSVTIVKPTGRIYAGILIGSISRGTITDCSATGDVSATAWLVGGLVGCSSLGSVTNCFATGNINAGSGEAGGLIGFCSSSVSKSYATGNVTGGTRAGGLVAGQSGESVSITDCFATGNVSGSASDGAAGLVGSNMSTRVTNSYATGNVSSTSPYIGRFIGRNVFASFVNCYLNSNAEIKKDGANFAPASVDGITSKTKAEMQTDNFKGNLNGTSGTIWGRDARNDNLPYIIGVGVGK